MACRQKAGNQEGAPEAGHDSYSKNNTVGSERGERSWVPVALVADGGWHAPFYDAPWPGLGGDTPRGKVASASLA